jgi:hypothetical protein
VAAIFARQRQSGYHSPVRARRPADLAGAACQNGPARRILLCDPLHTSRPQSGACSSRCISSSLPGASATIVLHARCVSAGGMGFEGRRGCGKGSSLRRAKPGNQRPKRVRPPGAVVLQVDPQSAGSPADPPETPPGEVARSPERRAQPRPGAILGRSMRRRSSRLRCLRRRRPDDPDDGADSLGSTSGSRGGVGVGFGRGWWRGRAHRWLRRRNARQDCYFLPPLVGASAGGIRGRVAPSPILIMASSLMMTLGYTQHAHLVGDFLRGIFKQRGTRVATSCSIH